MVLVKVNIASSNFIEKLRSTDVILFSGEENKAKSSINHNTDINARNVQSETPLHLAALHGLFTLILFKSEFRFFFSIVSND